MVATLCLLGFVLAPGQPRTALAWGWFTADEMRRLPMPPLNRALVDRLAGLPSDAEPPA